MGTHEFHHWNFARQMQHWLQGIRSSFYPKNARLPHSTATSSLALERFRMQLSETHRENMKFFLDIAESEQPEFRDIVMMQLSLMFSNRNTARDVARLRQLTKHYRPDYFWISRRGDMIESAGGEAKDFLAILRKNVRQPPLLSFRMWVVVVGFLGLLLSAVVLNQYILLEQRGEGAESHQLACQKIIHSIHMMAHSAQQMHNEEARQYLAENWTCP